MLVYWRKNGVAAGPLLCKASGICHQLCFCHHSTPSEAYECWVTVTLKSSRAFPCQKSSSEKSWKVLELLLRNPQKRQTSSSLTYSPFKIPQPFLSGKKNTKTQRIRCKNRCSPSVDQEIHKATCHGHSPCQNTKLGVARILHGKHDLGQGLPGPKCQNGAKIQDPTRKRPKTVGKNIGYTGKSCTNYKTIAIWGTSGRDHKQRGPV